jgi:hypothetical protein
VIRLTSRQTSSNILDSTSQYQGSPSNLFNLKTNVCFISIPLGSITARPSSLSASRVASITFEEAVKSLYAPLLAPINASVFVDPADGDTYYLPGEPIWSNPLGKDLCIVDVDTRPLNETNQLMNEEFNWQTIAGVSTGMLNHYLYGTYIIHLLGSACADKISQQLFTAMIINLSTPPHGTTELATMSGRKYLHSRRHSSRIDL